MAYIQCIITELNDGVVILKVHVSTALGDGVVIDTKVKCNMFEWDMCVFDVAFNPKLLVL